MESGPRNVNIRQNLLSTHARTSLRIIHLNPPVHQGQEYSTKTRWEEVFPVRTNHQTALASSVTSG